MLWRLCCADRHLDRPGSSSRATQSEPRKAQVGEAGQPVGGNSLSERVSGVEEERVEERVRCRGEEACLLFRFALFLCLSPLLLFAALPLFSLSALALFSLTPLLLELFLPQALLFLPAPLFRFLCLAHLFFFHKLRHPL